MAIKPSELPRWSSVDTFNGPGSQLNYSEPPEEKKDVGWGYSEKPAREWQNYLQRRTYEWLLYIDEELDTSGNLNNNFAQDPNTTTGLTYGFRAGIVMNDGALTTVAAGTLALTLNTLNSIYLDLSDNTVKSATGAVPANTMLLAEATTNGTDIISVVDKRSWAFNPAQIQMQGNTDSKAEITSADELDVTLGGSVRWNLSTTAATLNVPLGIGTSTPQELLHLQDTGLTLLRVQSSDNSGSGIYFANTGSTDRRLILDNSNLRYQDSTGSTEYLTILSDGKLGIGNTSPSANLHIGDAASTSNSVLRLEGSSFSTINFADAADVNVGLIQYNHSTNSMSFNTNDSEALTITSAGNIQLSNNAQPLEWTSGAGVINSTDSLFFNLDSNNDNPDNSRFLIAKNRATNTGGTALFEVNESGAVDIFAGPLDMNGNAIQNTSFQFADGTAASPSLTFTSDQDTGIYRSGTNQIGFSAAGSQAAVIASTGIYSLDGIASAPSIGFINDGNTGIFSPGADIIGFTTAGSEIARMTNVSLDLMASLPRLNMQRTGTVTTQTRNTIESLNSAGNVMGGIAMRGGGDNNSGIIDFYVTPDNSAGSSLFDLTLAARFNSAGNFLVGTTTDNPHTGTDGVAIDADNYVSISRTSNPGINLNRNTTDGSLINLYKDGALFADIGVASGSLTFDVSGPEVARFTSAGDFGLGELSPDCRLHVKDSVALNSQFESTGTDCRVAIGNSVSGVGISNGLVLSMINSSSSIYNYENGNLNLGTNGAADLTIDSAGNVDIVNSFSVNGTQVTEIDGITRMYAGRVATGGTAVSLPSGWSVAKVATGRYQITHDLPDNQVTITATAYVAGRTCEVTSLSGSVIQIDTRSTTTNSLTDGPFAFHIFYYG